MRDTLAETIYSWDHFASHGLRYLDGIGEEQESKFDPVDAIESVRDEVEEMRRLLRKLNHEIVECEAVSSSVSGPPAN